MNYQRKSGILLHPTSLPGKYGIGTLGVEAYTFIDFLILSGQKMWQTCPLGPTGYGDSPYQCFSAYAGNPLLIDLDILIEDGFLKKSDVGTIDCNEEAVEYGPLIEWKYPIFKKAFTNFNAIDKKSLAYEKYNRFCLENNIWLDDYALFMSLKDNFNGKQWTLWPADIKMRNPEAIKKYTKDLESGIHFHKYLQFEFFTQWKKLKSYANNNSISIIGDIPLYVAFDSCDAWASSHLFQFDKDRNPTQVAGVPPDYFSATGQLWGNPLYNWDQMIESGFEWWINRIKSNLQIADIVRFDHFRGLCAYWAVPFGDKTAINGEWVKAPGDALFTAIEKALGKIPLIAEDLGVITPDVVALREKFDLPGMKILQFAFDSEESSSKNFIPHVYDKNCVVYTGTHDNDTVTGWYKNAKPIDKEYATSYLGIKDSVSFPFIKGAWASTAVMAIATMQDVLSLGSEARMNTPGVAGGNWQWRYTSEKITSEITAKLKEITTLYGR